MCLTDTAIVAVPGPASPELLLFMSRHSDAAVDAACCSAEVTVDGALADRRATDAGFVLPSSLLGEAPIFCAVTAAGGLEDGADPSPDAAIAALLTAAATPAEPWE
jgi:hypothetical protein